MSTTLRLLPCGENAILIEAPDPAAARALFAALSRHAITGVTGLRPAARTVFVTYDPAATTRAALDVQLRGLHMSSDAIPRGRDHIIPMRYDGPDLAEVAAYLALSPAEVIARHQAATFTVAFCGFAPGFAYLTCDDPVFNLPRRATPRPHVPAGSVALAGGYGAVYPTQSPGGWQIIGQTDLPMWDADTVPPARLSPGDRVRFRADDSPPSARPVRPFTPEGRPMLRIDHAWQKMAFADLGRPEGAKDGVPCAGALDRDAFLSAQDALGNPPDTAALEVTAPIRITALSPEVLVLTGAPMPATLHGADGQHVLPHGRPFAVDAGDSVTFDAPARGRIAYLARRGGFDLPQVLGSASTDTLSGLGPAAAVTGDLLYAGRAAAQAVTFPPEPASLPRAGEEVEIPLLPGPRMDWFTDDAITALTEEVWTMSADFSRVGLRLDGPALPRKVTGELASEAVLPGAIQIPHDGRPMVFLRDAPVTGGYPVIAVVPESALSRLAQCPPQTRLRFRLLRPFCAPTITLAKGSS